MRFTVTWNPSVLDDLSEIWMEAADRQEVTDAARLVEETLLRNADRVGEEFYGDRLLVEPTLAVVFSLSIDDRRVRIESVWYSPAPQA